MYMIWLPMNWHHPSNIEYRDPMGLRTRKLTDEQIQKFEGYASEIFSALGLDLNRPATKAAPQDTRDSVITF